MLDVDSSEAERLSSSLGGIAVSLGRVEENVKNVREGQKTLEEKFDVINPRLRDVEVAIASIVELVKTAHERIDEVKVEAKNSRDDAARAQEAADRRRAPWTAIAALALSLISPIMYFGDRFWGQP